MGDRELSVGVVASIQTHGALANWHSHLHLRVTDGGFRPDGRSGVGGADLVIMYRTPGGRLEERPAGPALKATAKPREQCRLLTAHSWRRDHAGSIPSTRRAGR